MLNVATLRPQMLVATLFRCIIILGSLLSGEIAFRVLPRASDPNRSEQNTLLLLNSAVNPFFCSSAFSDVIVVVAVGRPSRNMNEHSWLIYSVVSISIGNSLLSNVGKKKFSITWVIERCILFLLY